jgi:hypothetical protein
MAYHSDDSCFGCFGYIVFIAIMGMLGLIRDCACGSNKSYSSSNFLKGCTSTHNNGSKSVSGGTGTIGTTNGANIQYPQTTDPNFNSSTNDYSSNEIMPLPEPDTRSKETVTNIQESSSSQIIPDPPISDTVSILRNISPYKKHREKCPSCNGVGKIKTEHYFSESPVPCWHCGKTSAHTHIFDDFCRQCAGVGEIEIIEYHDPDPIFIETYPYSR